ncbi:hypothetical protein PFISCL1PPCAC_1702 [Pristionchus fissidentatus]|uniref:Zinc finger CCCH domain-containing protein 14 n=1 Tax=Pristionchus fissidentatus TaxID=1538716 RepID=A0AAV5UW69_9BILA|nr:hypothetical protein PFISCL1PPCAC_1702 [Pristionchus fissidentatus]
MNTLSGYRQWIETFEYHNGSTTRYTNSFINNYWCAALTHLMSPSTKNDEFNIPYFIVEEELIRENDNANLEDKSEAYISNALKYFLVHLLKRKNSKANIANSDQLLHEFLESDGILPLGISNPLTSSTSFHFLPSECKLWILCALQSNGETVNVLPKHIYKDFDSNLFYLLPPCRLYVQICHSPSVPFSNEDRVNKEEWKSLFLFTNQHSLKLVAEDRNGWDAFWRPLLRFGLTGRNIYNGILPVITVKLIQRDSIVSRRDGERQEFNNRIARITPIPIARRSIVEQRASSSTVKETTISQSVNRPVSAEEVAVNPICVVQPIVRGNVKIQAEVNEESSGNKGLTADKLAVPTLPQRKKSCETTIESIENGKEVKKKGRCQFFPQCTNGENCDYFHPVSDCMRFAKGLECAGQWCRSKHGVCPQDGDCNDLTCIYEHYESLPVRKRNGKNGFVKKKNSETTKIELPNHKLPRSVSMVDLSKEEYCEIWKQDEPRGILSRRGSKGNISSCGNRMSERKKSVTFGPVSDLTEKSSSHIQTGAVNIQKPQKNTLPKERIRCRHFHFCEREDCRFVHPEKNCPKFPDCPRGGSCLFLHPKCEKNGDCVNEKCTKEHDLLREIEKKYWCTIGSFCDNRDCEYIHPQDCSNPCPTPGNCWKYHNPSKEWNHLLPTPQSTHNQIPSLLFPPNFGYGPMPYPFPTQYNNQNPMWHGAPPVPFPYQYHYNGQDGRGNSQQSQCDNSASIVTRF